MCPVQPTLARLSKVMAEGRRNSGERDFHLRVPGASGYLQYLSWPLGLCYGLPRVFIRTHRISQGSSLQLVGGFSEGLTT